MILKDISFPTSEENILFDEVLLSMAETGEAGETLRFWEAREPFIVLGRICKEDDDLHVDEVREAGIAVLRRFSGGGTIVQGPGCLNFSLILSRNSDQALHDLRKSYRFILDKVITALESCGVRAMFHPISDLAVGSTQKKISGNAQHRGRNFILHHGTILYNFDLALVSRFLRIPKDVPEYRQRRGHDEFIVNVPVAPDDIKKAFLKTFGVREERSHLSDQELKLLKDLFVTRPVRVVLK